MDSCMLIRCQPGRFRQVAKELNKLKNVIKAFTVVGRWDVVVHVSHDDLKTLRELALKVHSMHGVESVETLVGFLR